MDGAHIPGHYPLSINSLQPDIYVGACHKWLICPKGVSFLYVNKKYQKNMDPLIISWGYDSEYPSDYSEFQAHHYWQGTRDISAFLTIPDAIEFREKYYWEIVSQHCKNKIIRFREEVHNILESESLIASIPVDWLGQMYSFQINYDNPIKLKSIFINDYKIEIPISKWKNDTLMRISLNGYNTDADIDKLLSALKKYQF